MPTEPTRDFKLIPVKQVNTAGRSRVNFPEKDMALLKESIKEALLIHPITVKKYDQETAKTMGFQYFLLAGGRRLLAYQQLAEEQSSYSNIPATILTNDLDAETIRRIELEENLVRSSFTMEEELALKKKLHELREKKYGKKVSTAEDAPGVSRADTARLVGETPQMFNEDLRLAELFELDPSLKGKFKNKTEAKRALKLAMKKVERKKGLEKETSKQDKSTKGKVQSILDSYIVGNFFSLVTDFKDASFDLINHDIDFPMDITDTDILRTKFNKDVERGAYHKVPVDQYKELTEKSFSEAYRLLKPDGWLVVWFGLEYYEFIKQALLSTGFLVGHTLGYWRKLSGSTRNPDTFFNNTLEPFFYARRSNKSFIQKPGHSDTFTADSIHYSKKIHPFQKPASLMKEIFSTLTCEGAKVLDCFAGSGDANIGARLAGMSCISTELSPVYKSEFELNVKETFK